MGEITVRAFGVLCLLGLVLVGAGLVRRTRVLIVLGGALLLAIAGAWMFGLPGAAAGLVAFGFLKPGRPRSAAG